MSKRPSDSMASAFGAPDFKPRRLNPPPTPSRSEVAPSITPGRSQAARNNEEAAKNLLNVSKIYNDPIHTAIMMDKLSQQIIDTPEYQRLASLKQLGTCSYVFRGATHSRFEHSLGVAHLAERVVRKLQDNQPELKITEVDILCVKIAGLCHDLGHGPFSHVYDGVFIPLANPNFKWRHEDGSVQMLRLLIEKNGIQPSISGLTPRDILFIEEIISGEKKNRKGRGPDKSFLYDVVNNTRSGLDVDKLDYFQRDMRYTNVTFAANFERFIELGRVIKATPEGYVPPPQPSIGAIVMGSQEQQRLSYDNLNHEDFPLMICYPEKMVTECVDMFSVRFRMHKQVYTHKAVKQVEFMITDALLAADPHIRVLGSVSEEHPDGLYRISECVQCMQALARLNDGMLEVIKQDRRPELKQAQDILDRLDRRRLYVCLGKSAFRRTDRVASLAEEDICREICEISNRVAIGTYEDAHFTSTFDSDDEDGNGNGNGHGGNVKGDGSLSNLSQFSTASTSQFAHTPMPVPLSVIIVEKMHIHYGLKEKNPVARMRFYQRKAERDRTVGVEVKEGAYITSLPAVFEEQAVRIFCRSEDKNVIASARDAFEKWCKDVRCPTPFPSMSQSQGTLGDDGRE